MLDGLRQYREYVSIKVGEAKAYGHQNDDPGGFSNSKLCVRLIRHVSSGLWPPGQNLGLRSAAGAAPFCANGPASHGPLFGRVSQELAKNNDESVVSVI